MNGNSGRRRSTARSPTTSPMLRPWDPDGIPGEIVAGAILAEMLENPRIKPGESRLLWVGERSGMEQQAQDTADFLEVGEHLAEDGKSVRAVRKIRVHEHQRKLDQRKRIAGSRVEREKGSGDSGAIAVLAGPSDTLVELDAAVRDKGRR